MFGKNLNFLRKEKKLRQEDMAQQLGIARTTYAMYEQGNREPDYHTLKKLADFFNVSVDYLLDRTDKRIDNELDSEEILKDPDLNLWFKDIKDASPEKQKELQQFWKFIKQKDNIYNPENNKK